MKQTAAFLVLNCVLIAQSAERNKTARSTMSQKALDYVAAFQRGEDFTPPATGVFAGGQPDGAAVDILGKELAVGSPSVRESIVALLVDMGRRTDPLTPKGADVLRHPRILGLLAEAGLVKPDLGREAAMDALRKLATQPDLSRFENLLRKALEDTPSEEAFLLVAKAKARSARAFVDRLAGSAQWQNVEAAKIARAALGAKDVEDAFLALAANAEAARDGKALGRALGTLGLIGAPRSLRAIAERLRTPLTIHMPGAFEKSLRLNVLEALLYNFPDEPALYPNNIVTEADYTAAERFCAKTLGVTYRNPPPPFLTYRGYPIPLER